MRRDEPLDAVRARLGAHEGFAQVASVGQVHGADVAVVTAGGHVAAHDGLVTGTPGVLLTVISADCALVLLADAAAGVVGACHAGGAELSRASSATDRRGDARRSGPSTSRPMSGRASRPRRSRWATRSRRSFPTTSVVRRPEWPRPHVDLGADLARQLAEAGVAQAEVSGACTVAGVDRFFSYRAEDGRTGRMLGFVGITA